MPTAASTHNLETVVNDLRADPVLLLAVLISVGAVVFVLGFALFAVLNLTARRRRR